ncbi:MAG: hypothetical protein OQJ83_03470 [Altibacter sp.]|nr:hypothetical protein [Altibacter sp.]
MAARTPAFLDEWKQKGNPDSCFDCHSPTHSDGVHCTDCHSTNAHPYPKLHVPTVCVPCHDAPGEITIRSFRDSSAARRGEDCLACHLPDKVLSHDFRGPSRRGFLDGIASLTIAYRRDVEGDIALLRIRHKAGHALPGGTTGRAVWLLVEQVDGQGVRLDEHQYRFGWLHSPTTGWRENTLPPGIGKVIEMPLHEAAKMIRAKLIYRFRTGDLDVEDLDQVILVEETRTLSFRINQ